jgi:hypothetical protein
MAWRLGVSDEIDVAVEPLARHHSALARARLEDFGNFLSTLPNSATRAVLRLQGSIRAICVGVQRHAAYFDSRVVHEPG